MSESDELVFSLYDSPICRLCGEQNLNGYPLYKVDDTEDEDLSQKINTYLPLRISDDGIYPRWICPGCHLQVESTVQFFTLILSGQDILRILHKEEEEKVKAQIISSIDDVSEKNDDTLIVFEMPEFLYPSDHELAQTVAPVKRKRGRPRKSEKPKPEDDDVESSAIEDPQNDQHPIYSGRLKRRIKVPSRYQEAVKGQELEKVFVDMGLEEKDKSALDSLIDSTLDANDSKAMASEELIGHVQDDKGINLGDLIAVNVDGKGKRLKQTGVQKTKTRFMCDICKVCFWHEQRFLQHRFSHHSVSFECIQCLKSFKDRKYLIQHQIEETHSGEGLIEDPVTDSEPTQQPKSIDDDQINYLSADTAQNVVVKFEDVDEMDSAVKLHLDLKGSDNSKDGILYTQAPPEINQEEANIITVPTFGEERNLESSQNEIDLANVDKFTCKQCKQDFVEFNAYIEHKKNEHSVGRRFICSKCRRTFTTKTLLRRHQVVHSEARPHICTICSAAFKTKTNLINHQVKHNNSRRFSCKVCDQKFVHKHSLKLHLRVHSGSKPFKCPQCGKGFNQHGNMQEHMRVHTGERPFQCTICPKSFKTSSQCRIHIKRHEVDRPLKCSKCEKSFLSMEELKVHERRHENIKPYKCNHCDKSFIDMPALRKHTRLHTGEKPFGCPECGRHFADRSNLNKHQKLHESKRKNNDLLLSVDEQISGDGTPVAELTSNSFNSNSLILCDVNAAGDESVWNVIEDCITNPAKLDENEPLIKPGDDTAAAKQVVYVTYQDPNNPVDNKTTLYVVE